MPSDKKAIMIRPTKDLLDYLEKIRREEYGNNISMAAVIILQLEIVRKLDITEQRRS